MLSIMLPSRSPNQELVAFLERVGISIAQVSLPQRRRRRGPLHRNAEGDAGLAEDFQEREGPGRAPRAQLSGPRPASIEIRIKHIKHGRIPTGHR